MVSVLPAVTHKKASNNAITQPPITQHDIEQVSAVLLITTAVMMLLQDDLAITVAMTEVLLIPAYKTNFTGWW